jgi:hypothetical protein
MAIVVVGGGHRGIGKTALVCGLILALPEYRWIAVKITSDDHGKTAQVWEETEAGKRTDTARYLTAGAARAFLITASEENIKEHIAEFQSGLGFEQNLIYESNRIVEFVRPDVCLLVDNPSHALAPKNTLLRIAAIADATVSRGPGNSVCARSDSVGGGLGCTSTGSGAARTDFQLVAFERISPQMREWVRQRIPEKRNQAPGVSGMCNPA